MSEPTPLTHSVRPRSETHPLRGASHVLRGAGIGPAWPICGRSCGLLAVVIKLDPDDVAFVVITCTRCRVICGIEDVGAEQMVRDIRVPCKGVARAKQHNTAQNKERWAASALRDNLRHAEGIVAKAKEMLSSGDYRAAKEQAELAARFLTNDKGDD